MTDRERRASSYAAALKQDDLANFATLGLVDDNGPTGSYYLNTWSTQRPERVFNVTVSNSSR